MMKRLGYTRFPSAPVEEKRKGRDLFLEFQAIAKIAGNRSLKRHAFRATKPQKAVLGVLTRAGCPSLTGLHKKLIIRAVSLAKKISTLGEKTERCPEEVV